MSREDRAALLRLLILTVVEVDEPQVLRLRDRATRTLKDFKGPRVNQFAVQDRLRGLVERAEILNRDDLGHALDLWVANANGLQDRFMPEYLTLLLELSDSPIERTDLGDLHRIKDATSAPHLSWDDIIRDDPLDNADGLWDRVDFAGDGSSEEDELSEISASTDDSVDLTALSLHQDIDDQSRHHEATQALQNIEALETLRSEWADVKNGTGEDVHFISELQIVREIIFMLHGLDSDLFETSNGKIIPRSPTTVQHISQELLQQILEHFSSLGKRLSILREHTQIASSVHVFQTYQSCLSTELHSFDLVLSGLESRCLTPSELSPTLLELLSEVRAPCKKLLPLGEICKNSKESQNQEVITLEFLFNLACSQQGVGELEAFTLTANVFDKCFHTYLQPINDWIFRAEIDQNGGASFLKETPVGHHLKNTWSLDFQIIYDSSKTPKAPTFLQPFVTTIFNTGKSLKFLHTLGKEPKGGKTTCFQLGTVLNDPISSAFIPFSEQFRNSFEQWLKPVHERVTGALSHTLRFECGLQRTIEALHNLFLGQHGPSLDFIADILLAKYTDSPLQLADSAVLTGVYQEAFSDSNSVSEELISIRSRRLPPEQRNTKGIGALLATMEVSYRMPWTVSNIVLPTTLDSYRRIHATLLQLRVAKRAIDEKFHQKMIKHGATHSRVGVQALRLSHRLRWFVHTLQSYFLGVAIREAIPPFLQKINDTGDLDFKIEAHSSFVLNIEKRLLLHESAATAHQAIDSILDLIVKAAHYLQRQWMSLYPSTSRDGTEGPQNGALDHALPSLADVEESLERLKGFEATYTKFLWFVYTSVQESARIEGDKCLQMLVESLSLGTPSQIQRG